MVLGKKDTTGPLWRRQLCLSRSPLSLSSLFLANCASVYETKAERDREGKQGRALFIPSSTKQSPQTQKRNFHRPPGNLQLLPRHRAEGESGEEKMKEVGRGREKIVRGEGGGFGLSIKPPQSLKVQQSGLTLVVFL